MLKGLAITLSLICVSLPALAQAPPMMPASQVQRGMRGVCHTVFQGSQIEPFDFEVLGTMHGMLGPKLDIFLARLEGDKAGFTGVVAGMSGSPCYINNQLIGALSYRFGQFTKEPIAGITPIAEMLKIFEIPTQINPANSQAYQPLSYQQALAQLPARQHNTSWQGQATQVQAISTPLQMGGISAKTLSIFGADLQKLGFEPVAASSSGQHGNPQAPRKLEMGGSIAGQMVRGDISMSGTGTVSYVDGDKVLAFGHPFFNSGQIQLPMATSYIQHILVSEAGSYKMAEDGVEVGTITQDRATAIAGKIGQYSRMIPVQLQMHDQARVDAEQVNFEVFQNPSMTPMMMAVSVYNSLQGRLQFNQGGNIKLTGQLKVDGRSIDFNRFYSASEQEEVEILAARDLADTLFKLWNNPFHTPKIESMKLDFRFRPESLLATIDEIWADRLEVRPGESVNLHVRLKNYRQADLIRHLKIEIPSDAQPGPMSLLASSGALLDQLEDGLKTDYLSYQEILDDLSQKRASDQLYLKWIAEEPGISLYSKIYPKLPASVAEQLDVTQNMSHTVPLIRSPGIEYSFPTQYDLRGQQFIKFFVSSQGRVIN